MSQVLLGHLVRVEHELVPVGPRVLLPVGSGDEDVEVVGRVHQLPAHLRDGVVEDSSCVVCTFSNEFHLKEREDKEICTMCTVTCSSIWNFFRTHPGLRHCSLNYITAESDSLICVPVHYVWTATHPSTDRAATIVGVLSRLLLLLTLLLLFNYFCC